MSWSIVPFLNNWEMTEAACLDLLAQSNCRMKVLLIDKSQDLELHEKAKIFADEHRPNVLPWIQDPPLLSLAATWNHALDFAWESQEEFALVCNNDIRLTADTHVSLLHGMMLEEALFVSATGVREEGGLFEEAQEIGQAELMFKAGEEPRQLAKGGPDFSCFLISRLCHEKYRFDEQFIPAFCEDLDYHRRMMLGGDGQQIFSINVRYLHYASQTLVAMSEEKRDRVHQQISQGSRAHYQRKWGGPVNQETLPEGAGTTAEMFEKERQKWNETPR